MDRYAGDKEPGIQFTSPNWHCCSQCFLLMQNVPIIYCRDKTEQCTQASMLVQKADFCFNQPQRRKLMDPEIISLFKRSIIAPNYPSVRKAEGWLGLKWVEPDNGNGPATMTFDFASTGYDSVRTHALETHQSS